MKLRIGSILVFGGFAGLIYSGINYFNNTESFGFLGADFVVSKGDPTGMIIALGVIVLGMLLQYMRS